MEARLHHRRAGPAIVDATVEDVCVIPNHIRQRPALCKQSGTARAGPDTCRSTGRNRSGKAPGPIARAGIEAVEDRALG